MLAVLQTSFFCGIPFQTSAIPRHMEFRQRSTFFYSPELRCVWTGRGTGQTGPGTGSVLPSATSPAGQSAAYVFKTVCRFVSVLHLGYEHS
jgi:hypothetical protein